MYADTRPKFRYLFPDGRTGLVIRDHGDVAPSRIDLQIKENDPLWPTAERRAGTSQRFVWLTLVGRAS